MINRVTLTPQTDILKLTPEEKALAARGLADLVKVSTEAVTTAYLDNNDHFDSNPDKGSVFMRFQIGDTIAEHTAIIKPDAGKIITPDDIKEYREYAVNDKTSEAHFASLENDKDFDTQGDGKIEKGMLIITGDITAGQGDSYMTEVFFNKSNKSITVINEPFPDTQ
jgi:hypothetical protein